MGARVEVSDGFRLSAGATAEQTAALVAETGLAVIDGYLPPDTIDTLVAECDTIFDDDAPWLHPEPYSLGKSVRMERADIDPARYPTLAAAFADPFLEAVVDAHFGEGYLFSRTVYVILDVVGTSTHVQELHYDKMRHLKAFFYLTDVGPDHGPFHCVPGSHIPCATLQADNRARRIVPTDADVRQLPDWFEDAATPILGDRGTLIVFDSDLAHRAGVPTAGPRLATRSLSFGSYRLDDWYRSDGSLEVVE